MIITMHLTFMEGNTTLGYLEEIGSFIIYVQIDIFIIFFYYNLRFLFLQLQIKPDFNYFLEKK